MFKEIFECSPVAMLLVDEDSKIILANKHVEVLFGYSVDELVGENIDILVPTEMHGTHSSLVRNYFRDPEPRQMGMGRNLFGVKKNKVLFPIEVGLNPISTEGKTFVMSSVIDISERLRAEDRFKAAFDAAPCGMIMIDQRGKIVLLNKKTLETFGYQREELINQPIELLVPDDLKGAHPNFVKSFVKKPESRAMGTGRELFGRHKSGKPIPVEIGLQPVESENEIFVISSVVDITQRKEAEREIQSKSDEIKEFAYRTSHDLKSPLLSIGGILDYAVEDAELGDTDSVLNGLKRVKSLTKKLETLVDDILTLTKVDLETETLKPFDFQDYLDTAKEKFSHLFEKNQVKLSGSFQQQKDLVVQNTRLTQVLDNLVSNAAKYCDDKKSQRYVRIEVFNDKKKFYIQVTDNGLGFPGEQKENVFGMFKRFHEGKVDGTGLGLYIVKKHVQKMGADIRFDSSSQGTTFYIELLIP